MKHFQVENGLNMHLLQTRKFKTNIIAVLIRTDLTKESATRNVLLAEILKSGCRKFDTELEIARECEKMHGAALDIGTVKKGEEHIIQLYIEVLNDRFCEEEEGGQLFDRAGDLLSSILFDPLVFENRFGTQYMELLKERVRQTIIGKINDKKKYALDRCIEVMCENERFCVSADGSEEQLFCLDAVNMYKYYKKLISQSPIEIAIIGDVGTDRCERWARRLFSRGSKKIAHCEPAAITGVKGGLKKVREEMDISQGKLVVGARCDFSSKGRDFYRLLLFNEVAGGGAYSKFFVEIREKHSLCYYINSFIYRAKAIMIIQAGIDERDYTKVTELIFKIFDVISKGGITAGELELARSAIINRLETLKDSPQGLIDFHMTGALLGDYTDIPALRDILGSFTADEICDCADRISFDTSYFLTRGAGE